MTEDTSESEKKKGALNYGAKAYRKKRPDCSKLEPAVDFSGDLPLPLFKINEEIAVEILNPDGSWLNTFVCQIRKIEDLKGLVTTWNKTSEQWLVLDMAAPDRHVLYLLKGKRLAGVGKRSRGSNKKKKR